MPRLVLHQQAGPYRIDPADFPKDGKAMFICGCGLSSRMPYCDGTHKTCKAEQPDKVYVYDPDTKQVIEERPLNQPPGDALQP
jgi:CDGSH-type Zn-finger protein